MNITFAILGFLNAITGLIFGSFVYLKDPKKELNRIFGLMNLSIFVWGFGYGMWQLSSSYETALLWCRILSIGATLIPISFLHWILLLIGKRIEYQKLLIFGYLFSLMLLGFSWTSYFVQSLAPISIFPFWPQAGLVYYLFAIIAYGGIAGSGIILLLKTFLKSSGFQREQLKYVLLAAVLGLGGGATNLPQWFGVSFIPFGTVLVPFYPFLFAYAITRYRLMDIRIVIGKGAVYVLSFIVVIAIALLLLLLNNELVVPVPINVASSLILIIGILLFQFVFRFFEKWASRYFYYTFYSYQTVLTDLGKRLTKFLELDKLSSLIINTLINTMKLDKAVTLLREPGDGEYRIQKNIGFREENGISLVKDNFLTVWLERTQKPLVYEELSLIVRDTTEKEEKGRLQTLQSNMKRIEAALCLPLFIEEKIIGMIVLGNKLSGEPYSTQDIELLTNLANQASIALQNAKLYSEVRGFSKKLEREVEKATQELREAYEDLKKLDKAKSEFISIASHQLRTPLTAIKGYISMINEGTYGKLPENMGGPLNNIYASNERLIKLVNDLLSVSRIEAGRMETKLEKLSLESLISSVLEELSNIAKEKGLYLKWEKPKKPLPKISVDKDQFRQVVMNVIDNAIRYTEKGGITIKCEMQDAKCKIEVSDTGAGMTKAELSKMFESFSRGAAGTRLYTEGVGLGLYVARKFIEAHDGKVWAKSKGKDKGSTFYIELPMK